MSFCPRRNRALHVRHQGHDLAFETDGQTVHDLDSSECLVLHLLDGKHTMDDLQTALSQHVGHPVNKNTLWRMLDKFADFALLENTAVPPASPPASRRTLAARSVAWSSLPLLAFGAGLACATTGVADIDHAYNASALEQQTAAPQGLREFPRSQEMNLEAQENAHKIRNSEDSPPGKDMNALEAMEQERKRLYPEGQSQGRDVNTLEAKENKLKRPYREGVSNGQDVNTLEANEERNKTIRHEEPPHGQA
jgi:hypothetical protein